MTFLAVYLAIGLVGLPVAISYVLDVRGLINGPPGEHRPDAAAKKRADSALLVLLVPIWPVAALVAAAIAAWSLVQDVRTYYFKSNRKEGDR